MHHRRWTVGAVCIGVALGCTLFGGCGKGSYKAVPVSGKVTLDGKPVPGLGVTFQPVAKEQNVVPGPGSAAKTDDQGMYVLTLLDPKDPRKGAIVGKQKVRFSRQKPASEAGGDAGTRMMPDLDAILRRYQNTPWEVEVPPGGTKDMDFELRQK